MKAIRDDGSVNLNLFKVYDDVDRGVVAIAKDRESTILYCNRLFSGFLGTDPHMLQGRSLNKISVNEVPHSVRTQEFAKLGHSTSLGRTMLGGISVDGIIQEGPNKGTLVSLNVEQIESYSDFMLGYVRVSTRLEQVIQTVTLNPVVDMAWKPIARFFLSGKWRPIATAIASVVVPTVLNQHPEILSLIRDILQLL